MKKLIMILILTINIIGANGGSRAKEQKSLDFIDLCVMHNQTECMKDVISGKIKFLTAEEWKEKQIADSIKRDKKKRLGRILKNKWGGDLIAALGVSESGNNYKIYNKYGYLGKYQFGKGALQATGYGYVTFEEFKKNPEIFDEVDQYDAMTKLLKINYRILRKYVKQYEGSEINGVLITKAGILAGAHLGGARGVIKYLKSNGKYNPQDAYGTSIQHYLKKFSNYNVNLA